MNGKAQQLFAIGDIVRGFDLLGEQVAGVVTGRGRTRLGSLVLYVRDQLDGGEIPVNVSTLVRTGWAKR